MKKILVHGSGQKAASWNKTVSRMETRGDILCPELHSILNGKQPDYQNLYASFKEYCNGIDGRIHLCGLSLGGILALNFALDFPEKTETLVLIGTPHKVPKVMFSIQNMIFRFLPESCFNATAFGKRDMFVLGNSMKDLDFSGEVQKLRCPTLILCGEKDGANRKSAGYFSRNIAGAEMKIIGHTGHIVNEENPAALAQTLDEFYRKHE